MPKVDRKKVWDRIRSVQNQIAATDDNPDRYRDMGIDIIAGHARLTGANRATVEGDAPQDLETRYVLLCTGSRPVEPAIAGLADAGFVTSENLFELTDPPASFVNIGGGPIAVEMVQGFTRLGIPRHVAAEGSADPAPRRAGARRAAHRQAAQGGRRPALRRRDREGRGRGRQEDRDGNRGRRTRAAGRPTSCSSPSVGARTSRTSVSRISASRRRPKGVVVDNRGRTSVDTIYACGDIAGRYLFTHSAAYEGVRAVRDMFFPGKGKVVGQRPVGDVHRSRAGARGPHRDRSSRGAQGRRRRVADGSRAQRPGPRPMGRAKVRSS